MSEIYKTVPGGLYFTSFSVVNWYDVFIRREYQDILVDSIKFCQKKKGLLLYCYCIMAVEAGFTDNQEGWRLSSANPESPIKMLDL